MTTNNDPSVLPTPFKTSWIVKDLEVTMGVLANTCRLGPWDVFEYHAEDKDLQVGNPFAIKVAWTRSNGMTYELIQPMTDGSVWADFLKHRGEGMHLAAYSVPETWAELVSRLEGQGATTLLSAVFEGNRWCYMEMGPGNFRIELTEES